MNKELALERFGVVNEETGEVVVDRDALKRDFINRGVRILHEIDMLKEDAKAIVDEAVSDHKFSKANISALIKHTHKNEIDLEIEKLEIIRAELNNLFEEDE